MNWLNGKYIREALSDDEFVDKYAKWAFPASNLKKLIPLVRERVDKFSDVIGLIHFFLSADVGLTEESFEEIKLDRKEVLRIFQFSLWRLEAIKEWNRDSIQNELQCLSEQLDIKLCEFLSPLFVAITGKSVSISVIESIAIIGIDVSRARIRDAVKVLGGISKKMQKSLSAEYRELASVSLTQK